MALITYEYKTDGVYCGGCKLMECEVFCNKFDEYLDFLEEERKYKRCQACIDEFGE